jgi:neutral ceramidase
MYVKGADTVLVSFRSANPRSNQRIEDTFLTVDLLTDDGSWQTRYVDGDWSTRFVWKGGEVSSYGVSFAEIFWEIPHDTPQGIYRICHYGTRRTFIGNVEWMLMHAPGWWILDAFGSMAIGISIQAIRLADSFYAPLSRMLRSLSFSTTRDFSGCSKGFLVRSGEH